MLRYPRVEIIKRKTFVPIYREQYEVQTMRPNRPMKFKQGLTKAQAMAYLRREIAQLKQEGYAKAIYNSMLVDLNTFRP
jgi:conserved domain protein